MRISIIIPAYNEEQRIQRTLEAYNDFFSKKEVDYELLVVVNGTTDSTPTIIMELQKTIPNLLMMVIPYGGKGLAIAQGFMNALLRKNDLIGFVDADMATSPSAYYELIANIQGYDAIIASRYISGAIVTPARPLIKRWGSKIFFETLTRALFGIGYYDTQCGAKLFKREVVEKITPYLSVRQWAFDIEILYLCKRFGFVVKEHPTIWHDQAGSKLQILNAGTKMLGALFKLRWRYWNMPVSE